MHNYLSDFKAQLTAEVEGLGDEQQDGDGAHRQIIF